MKTQKSDYATSVNVFVLLYCFDAQVEKQHIEAFAQAQDGDNTLFYTLTMKHSTIANASYPYPYHDPYLDFL